MNVTVKQVSSLDKIHPRGIGDVKLSEHRTVMGGEYFSYQIAIETVGGVEFKPEIDSRLRDSVKIYAVKNTVIDLATYGGADEDYLTKEPGLMPDILMPIETENGATRLCDEAGALWIEVKVPEGIAAGEYPITVKLISTNSDDPEISQTMTLDVIGTDLVKKEFVFTQWFHTDCIATAHNVPVYSEEHWALIDKYMALATDLGMNMILTPIITPPLDTDIGIRRPCTQLVRIEKNGDVYNFDFSLLHRWISLADKNKFKYFEMAHLFSQWGLKYSPNIKVTENGEESFMFGWHVDAQSDEYRLFLGQFLPALIEFCKKEGIKDRCRFHISDEPSLEHLEAYKYAHDIVKPLIDGCPIIDALSNYDFYEKGLIQIPVTASNHMVPFLEHEVENQMVYYCCAQYVDVGNRFLAMPSHRNRILGLQMYKYNIKGFLQWGYNFFNSVLSHRHINPYITSSGDKAYASGDPFSVYPVTDGVVPSLRALVFREALNDIDVCRTLEGFIGRDKVVEMIDEAAGMDVTFSEYPRNKDYIPDLIEKMEQMIKTYTA